MCNRFGRVITVLFFLFVILGWEKSPCSRSDRRRGPWNVQRSCSSQSLRTGLLIYSFLSFLLLFFSSSKFPLGSPLWSTFKNGIKSGCADCQLQRWPCSILSDGLHNSGLSWWVPLANPWNIIGCLSPASGKCHDILDMISASGLHNFLHLTFVLLVFCLWFVWGTQKTQFNNANPETHPTPHPLAIKFSSLKT